MRIAVLRAFAILLAVLTPAAAAEMRCDTVGVAQYIVPDLVAQNPTAQKLGLVVTDVRLIGVLSPPDDDTCLVEVTMNRGYVFKYKFRYKANGVATLDMVP